MAASLEKMEEQLRELGAEERARLAQFLLESLRGAPMAEIEVAWEREIGDRVAAYDRGDLKEVSAETVFAEARRLAR